MELITESLTVERKYDLFIKPQKDPCEEHEELSKPSKFLKENKEIESFENSEYVKEIKVHPLPLQIFEVRDWERMKKISEKLNALEAVFGMLNELTPEQREAFEKAVKRRPFFK